MLRLEIIREKFGIEVTNLVDGVPSLPVTSCTHQDISKNTQNKKKTPLSPLIQKVEKEIWLLRLYGDSNGNGR